MIKSKDVALISIERISHSILLLRCHRVILDRDLAAIYGVTTGRLNEAIKRNIERFPEDFMFRLTRAEAERSRSQIAMLKSGRGSNVKYLPHAFTEHGAIQAANILSSPRAVTMGIHVVRAYGVAKTSRKIYDIRRGDEVVESSHPGSWVSPARPTRCAIYSSENKWLGSSYSPVSSVCSSTFATTKPVNPTPSTMNTDLASSMRSSTSSSMDLASAIVAGRTTNPEISVVSLIAATPLNRTSSRVGVPESLVLLNSSCR